MNTKSLNLDCFSHGQIKSKLWLCNVLEDFLPQNSNVAILGSWYNILGFMLMSKCESKIQRLDGIDVDANVLDIADRICDYWIIENKNIKNILADTNTLDYSKYNVVINCSPEHMISNEWFNNIKPNTLICIQSSDVQITEEPWCIKTPHLSEDDMLEKYKLSKVLYNGTISIDYGSWGYKRFMLIGIK